MRPKESIDVSGDGGLVFRIVQVGRSDKFFDFES